MSVLELEDCDIDQDFENEFFEVDSNKSVKVEIERYLKNQDIEEEKIEHIVENFADFVSKTNLIQAVNIAYGLIKNNNFCDSSDESSSSIPEDVKFVVDLIHRVQKIVSQDFVGGVLVLHLIFIEGLKCDEFI